MDKQAKRIPLMERVRLTFKGYGIVAKIAPGYLTLSFAVSLITALQPAIALFFSARILNELTGARDIQRIVAYAAVTVGVSFALAVAKAFLQRSLDVRSGYMPYLKLFSLEAEQFARMDFAHTERSEVTEMLTDMDTRARGNGLGIMQLFWQAQGLMQQILSLALSVALLWGAFTSSADYERTFFTSNWATAILVALLVLMLVCTVLYRRREKDVLDRVFEENAKGNSTAWYYMKYVKADQAAKDVRLYNQKPALMDIFARSYRTDVWYGFFKFEGRLEGFNMGALQLIVGAVYIVVGLRALAGMYEIGSVVQYVGAITSFAVSIGTLVSLVGQMMINAQYIKPMLEFLALPGPSRKGTRPLPDPEDGLAFAFENVSFRYPGSEEYALKDLNLRIEANQRLAVVGLNGSGKTTMVKLLCRLYEPSAGRILLNGIDIQEYDYAQYHALFSVVFQDFSLFPLQLGRNVAAGMDADGERARRALDDAGFGERLARLPDGLDTILYKDYDESGVQMSGGEAQKIALARALYKNAAFVVLDEPTAALDPIAEYEVYSTFDKTIGDRTAVFISHRLSSCRFCHDIAVFEAGTLVQRGSHEELLREGAGRYHALWTAQAQHYVGDGNGNGKADVDGAPATA